MENNQIAPAPEVNVWDAIIRAYSDDELLTVLKTTGWGEFWQKVEREYRRRVMARNVKRALSFGGSQLTVKP